MIMRSTTVMRKSFKSSETNGKYSYISRTLPKYKEIQCYKYTKQGNILGNYVHFCLQIMVKMGFSKVQKFEPLELITIG